MTRITENRTHQPRTEAEIRDALSRFCNAAWAHRGANNRSCFTIPPDDQDADIVFMDVIDELLSARLRIVALEAEIATLRLSANIAGAYLDATKGKQ